MKYHLLGHENFDDKFDGILNLYPVKRHSKKAKLEFTNVAGYLLFFAGFDAVQTPSRLIKSISSKIDAASTAENIELWMSFTPDQYSILGLCFVVFVACWGSGKTLLMFHKAIQISKKGEKVLFLVFNADSKVAGHQTLLALRLTEQFKDHNIDIKSVSFIDGADNNLCEKAKGYKHVMLDEFFEDYDHLTQKSQDEIQRLIKTKETVWISISNAYHGFKWDHEMEMSDAIKVWFPNFHVAMLDKPLRLPSNIAKDIKSKADTLDEMCSLPFNPKLFRTIDVPIDMVEGLPIERIGFEKPELLPHLFKKAFGKVAADMFALIIIKELSAEELKSLLEKIDPACTCREIVQYLCIAISLYLNGRKPAKYHCKGFRSRKGDAEKWSIGDRQQDMVVSVDLAKGFESDIIVDIGGGPVSYSRAMAQLIIIDSHVHYDIISIIQMVLNHPEHKCFDLSDDSLNVDLSLDDFLLDSFYGEFIFRKEYQLV